MAGSTMVCNQPSPFESLVSNFGQHSLAHHHEVAHHLPTMVTSSTPKRASRNNQVSASAQFKVPKTIQAPNSKKKSNKRAKREKAQTQMQTRSSLQLNQRTEGYSSGSNSSYSSAPSPVSSRKIQRAQGWKATKNCLSTSAQYSVTSNTQRHNLSDSKLPSQQNSRKSSNNSWPAQTSESRHSKHHSFFLKVIEQEGIEDYRSSSKRDIPAYKDVSTWGKNDTANKSFQSSSSKTSNNLQHNHTKHERNTPNFNKNKSMNSFSNTCQSDSVTKHHTYSNPSNPNSSTGYQSGNNSDHSLREAQSNSQSTNRSNVRVATLFETQEDSYTKSLNDYNSNSKNKATSGHKNGQMKSHVGNFMGQRTRNSNSFSGKNKQGENSRFAGYAASPDPTTLPQPPTDWLTQLQSKNIASRSASSATSSSSSGSSSDASSGSKSPTFQDNSLSENDAKGKVRSSKTLFSGLKPEDLDLAQSN